MAFFGAFLATAKWAASTASPEIVWLVLCLPLLVVTASALFGRAAEGAILAFFCVVWFYMVGTLFLVGGWLPHPN